MFLFGLLHLIAALTPSPTSCRITWFQIRHALSTGWHFFSDYMINPRSEGGLHFQSGKWHLQASIVNRLEAAGSWGPNLSSWINPANVVLVTDSLYPSMKMEMIKSSNGRWTLFPPFLYFCCCLCACFQRACGCSWVCCWLFVGCRMAACLRIPLKGN